MKNNMSPSFEDAVAALGETATGRKDSGYVEITLVGRKRGGALGKLQPRGGILSPRDTDNEEGAPAALEAHNRTS